MKKYLFHLQYLYSSSILVSIISLSIVYLIIYRWAAGGFDQMEISLMAVFPGFIIFIVGLVILSLIEIRYLRDCIHENVTPIKTVYQVLYSSFSLLFFSFLLDLSYHFMIDDSIGTEFAEGLMQIMKQNGKDFDENDLSQFAKMPYFIQNGFVIAFFCALSNLIALPIGKSLFKTLSKRTVS